MLSKKKHTYVFANKAYANVLQLKDENNMLKSCTLLPDYIIYLFAWSLGTCLFAVLKTSEKFSHTL